MEDVMYQIERDCYEYLKKGNLKSVVMGISGGLDSAMNAVIMNRVCKELGIPFYGRFIHIETNKIDESTRADNIGKYFCSDYKNIDLTDAYINLRDSIESKEDINLDENNLTYEEKVRRGNIKARMRMIYLYNLAQEHKGLVIDNDNFTENLLGFFTLHGDVGDLTPLYSLYKTEVRELAKYYIDNILETEEEKAALQACLDCEPTDGLGITNSDVEQFGVPSYEVVDDILQTFYATKYLSDSEWQKRRKELAEKYGEEAVDKIVARHKNSSFKRYNPYHITVEYDEQG